MSSSSSKSNFFGRAWDRARGNHVSLPCTRISRHRHFCNLVLHSSSLCSALLMRNVMVTVASSSSILTLRSLAGKTDVERICKKVFEDLADKNTGLLDINSLHVATLMVYK